MATKKTDTPATEDVETPALQEKIRASKASEAAAERVVRIDPADDPPKGDRQALAKHRQRLGDEDRKAAEGAQRKIEARMGRNLRKQSEVNRRLNRAISALSEENATLKQENARLRAALAAGGGQLPSTD